MAREAEKYMQNALIAKYFSSQRTVNTRVVAGFCAIQITTLGLLLLNNIAATAVLEALTHRQE